MNYKENISNNDKKKVLKRIKKLQELLRILPKQQRTNLVNFINEEKEHGVFYLCDRIYAQLTDTVKCVADPKYFFSEIYYISGEKTIYSPYSGIEKDKHKNKAFEEKIFQGLSALLSLDDEEQKIQLNKIIHPSFYYTVKNTVVFRYQALKKFIKKKKSTIKDYLVKKARHLILKDYPETIKLNRLYQRALSSNTQKVTTQDLNFILGEPQKRPETPLSPKKIFVTREKQPIYKFKNINIHHYE